MPAYVTIHDARRFVRTDSPDAVAPGVTLTGFGASPTFSIVSGTSDRCGRIAITAGGAGIAATGTVVVVFAQSIGPNGSMGVGMLANTATGAWNARATLIATASGALSASFSFTWDNNAVALTSGNAYALHWILEGR